MLRRPPTEIKLTPEDVAAYDESRLARLQAEEQARIRAENAYLEGQLQGRAGNAGAEANATLEEKGDGMYSIFFCVIGRGVFLYLNCFGLLFASSTSDSSSFRSLYLSDLLLSFPKIFLFPFLFR